MAILCITEVRELGFDAQGNVVLAPRMPPVTEQSLAIGGASGPSAAFNISTRYIMVETDVPCCLAFSLTPGATPTAVVGFHRVGANETRFYTISPGDKIAVIASP